MPKRSKRRSHSQSAAARQWSNTNISDPNDSSSDEYFVDIDDHESTLGEKIFVTDIEDVAYKVFLGQKQYHDKVI